MKKKAVAGILCMTLFLAAGCSGKADLPKKQQNIAKEDQQDIAQGDQNGQEQEEAQPDIGKDGAQQSGSDLFSRKQTYTWQEMTVSIPDTWEGKYQVEEYESGFALIQTASYEKLEGMGMIVSFSREDGMVIDYAGSTPLAFTDTQTYYMTVPTDVNFYYEDPEIAGEYHEMSDLVEIVADTLVIDKEGVKTNPEEYVLPLSSTISLREDYLYNLNDNQLKIARNEIYARHGRLFRDPYLAAHFETCSWYEGTVQPDAFDEQSLSQTEKDNIRMIQKAEEEYQIEHPYPKEYSAAKRAFEDLNGDGTPDETFCIFEEEDTLLIINGQEYALSSFGVQLVTPMTDVFYITDIQSYEAGLEIALLDYGPSEDYETYFFSYQDELHYLGSVSGFPFAQQTGYNGFTVEGCIIGESRIDFTHTSHVYDFWWYDGEQQKLVHEEPTLRYYTCVPEQPHALLEDILVYRGMSEMYMQCTLPAQEKVFFLETDGKEWALLRGKDGTKGYIHIVDGKIKGLDKTPQEVFTGLDFVD